MKYSRECEVIKSGWLGEGSCRLKVPGGWVVNFHNSSLFAEAEAVCFVPDKDHSWELEDKK